MTVPRPATMPTGIASLDPVLDGGVPSGSVILLLGEIGAGAPEFAYSSVISLSLKKARADPPGTPAGLYYITLTRTGRSVLEEMELSFHQDLLAGVESQVTFMDLSNLYFESTVVPSEWYGNGDLIERLQRRSREDEPLAELAGKLSGIPAGSAIIIDSLTELATQSLNEHRWAELVAFLRGLGRVVKQWNSMVYLILTDGILEEHRVVEIADCCDAVMNFRWEETSAQRRQRIMFVQKFRGVMPHLEERDLVKFAVRISAEGGFEVANVRVVV
ncbi:MAG: hypothetical protein GKC04_03200 [Methanomicrobiales archaeon]|nr:hypothetical protein [Methanomicrobiales archaeon]